MKTEQKVFNKTEMIYFRKVTFSKHDDAKIAKKSARFAKTNFKNKFDE